MDAVSAEGLLRGKGVWEGTGVWSFKLAVSNGEADCDLQQYI